MVIRSASMWCSIWSMSKRRCSRIHAPVSSAITMLSRPRMCDGGVTICMRSADVKPQGVAPVPHGRGERAVGVPDRLGHARRARTEHEQRVGIRRRRFERAPPGRDGVVQRAASASARRAPDGRRRRATARSPPAHARLRSARHAGLSSTAAAPSRQMARSAITNSGRFDDISATRSPARTPRCSSVVAMPLASASSSAKVYSRSSKARAAGSLTSAHPPFCRPLRLPCRKPREHTILK